MFPGPKELFSLYRKERNTLHHPLATRFEWPLEVMDGCFMRMKTNSRRPYISYFLSFFLYIYNNTRISDFRALNHRVVFILYIVQEQPEKHRKRLCRGWRFAVGGGIGLLLSGEFQTDIVVHSATHTNLLIYGALCLSLRGELLRNTGPSGLYD